MTINELCQKAHENARAKGFWETEDMTDVLYSAGRIDVHLASSLDCVNISSKLMLIVSELAEALEALRNGDDDNFAEELADVAIRLGDLCGGLCINLEREIIKKMEKNRKRGYKHGKAF